MESRGPLCNKYLAGTDAGYLYCRLSALADPCENLPEILQAGQADDRQAVCHWHSRYFESGIAVIIDLGLERNPGILFTDICAGTGDLL